MKFFNILYISMMLASYVLVSLLPCRASQPATVRDHVDHASVPDHFLRIALTCIVQWTIVDILSHVVRVELDSWDCPLKSHKPSIHGQVSLDYSVELGPRPTACTGMWIQASLRIQEPK